MPYINYGIHIWGGTCATFLSKVNVLQNRVLRIITGVHPRTHAAPLFNRYGILSVDNLYKYNVGLFMYKYKNYMLPDVFESMFTFNSDVHSYDTRQRTLLHVPRPGNALAKKSFKYLAVLIWNTICENIIINIGIGAFKRNLKEFLRQ